MKEYLLHLAMIGTALVTATPALADSAQNLPGPGALGLVAAGIGAAIIVARRSN